jgi:hypothetical protein
LCVAAICDAIVAQKAVETLVHIHLAHRMHIEQARLADRLRAIIEHSPYLGAIAPAYPRYLLEFPKVSLPVIDSFVYWSKEVFGLKPVVSVTHVSVYQNPAVPTMLIGASKQIYASHYFEASLGLTMAVDDGSLDRPGMYLLYVNRTFADALSGAMSGLRRSAAARRARRNDDSGRFHRRDLRFRIALAA